MRKKQWNKRFIKRYQSELITFNVGILAVSTLLTLPSAVLLATTNEVEPAIQIQEEGIWRERGLDREYGLEEDILREMNLAADEKEDADFEEDILRESSIEEDEEDSDSEEENLRESNMEEGEEDSDSEEDHLRESNIAEYEEDSDSEKDHLQETNIAEYEEDSDSERDHLLETIIEDEEEEVEPIPVIGVNEKAELVEEYAYAATFEELENAVRDAKPGYNTVITITKSFDFEHMITINNGRHITIKSDQTEIESDQSDIEMVSPHVLSQRGTNRHFTIDNGSLTLGTSIVIDGVSKETDGGGIRINNGGHFIMQNGSISKNKARSGGGVNIDSGGKFTMIEGSINGNIADSEGGGIYAGANGKLTMLGGFIEHNKTINAGGGGVMLKANAVFEMKFGEIRHNEARQGGGLFLWDSSQLTITGGQIHDNRAGTEGGGIYAATDFDVKFATISNNRAGDHGGGIFVMNKIFNMVDGTIRDNTAGNRGGAYICSRAGHSICTTELYREITLRRAAAFICGLRYQKMRDSRCMMET